MSLEMDLSKLEDIYSQTLNVSYAAVALAVVALYDHFITMEGEIQVVWRRAKWNTIQILFLTTRYLCDALLIYTAIAIKRFVDFEFAMYRIIAWGSLIAVWTTQGIVMFRVSSMYSHSRAIITALVGAYSTEVVVTAVTQAIGLPNPDPSNSRYGPLPFDVSLCSPPVPPYWSNMLFWISVISFETFTFGLSLYKGVQTRRAVSALRTYVSTHRPSIIHVLLRDSITFPFISLSVCTLNFAGSLSKSSFFLTEFSVILGIFATQFVGARLILNLRETYYQPFDDEYFTQSHVKPPGPITFSPTVRRAGTDYYVTNVPEPIIV